MPQSKETFFFKARRNKKKPIPEHWQREAPPYELAAGMKGPRPPCGAGSKDTAASSGHSSFDLAQSLSDFGTEESLWRHAKLSTIGRARVLPFVNLAEGTDLNIPPLHYLRLEREAFVHRQAPGYVRDRDRALGCLLDAALTIERPYGAAASDGAPIVAAGEEALRRIVDAVAFGHPLSLDVHRVAGVAVLDAGLEPEVQTMSSPQGHRHKALMAKLLYKLADPAHALQRVEGPSTHASHSERTAETRHQLVPRDGPHSYASAPRVSALAITSLTGSAGEKEQQYAHVVRWQLGDSDLVLGLDRPILSPAQQHGVQSRNFFPIVLMNADQAADYYVARDTLFAWTVARLTKASQVVQCVHDNGRIVRFQATPVSEMQNHVFGSVTAAECLAAVLRVLRWLADQANGMGCSYGARQLNGTSTLLFRTRAELSRSLASTSLPWDALYGEREGLRRHRSAVGLLFVKGATAVTTLQGSRFTHDALTMLLRALEDLLESVSDTFWLRQGAIRQLVPSRERLAHMLEPPEEVEALTTILNVTPDLCVAVMRAGPTSLGAAGSVATAWVSRFVAATVRAVNTAIAMKRDLPPVFVRGGTAATDLIQTASDSLTQMQTAIALRLAFAAASAASRVAAAAVAAVRSMASDGTMPFELAAIGQTAVAGIASMEAVLVAAAPSMDTASRDTRSDDTAIAVSWHDARLEQQASRLGFALKEHLADLLTATLPTRRGVAQILSTAAQHFLTTVDADGGFGLEPIAGLRDRFKHVTQLSDQLSAPEPANVAYAVHRFLAQRAGPDAACGRIETKRARVHFALGVLHHSQGRITKALDSLALSADLVQAACSMRDTEPDDFAVAEEGGIEVAELRARVHLELANLHRTRASFERKSGSSASEIDAMERAVNCLREEVTRLDADASSNSRGSSRAGMGSNLRIAAECKHALGIIGALHVERVVARMERSPDLACGPRVAHQFEDMLDRLAESERLASLPAPGLLSFRIRVSVMALRSLTLRSAMENIPRVLAMRQFWGSRAWEMLRSGNKGSPDGAGGPAGIPEARVAWPEVRDGELRQALCVSAADAVRMRAQLLHLLVDYDLFMEAPQPEAPLPRAAEAARLLTGLIRDAGAAGVSPLPAWPELRGALLSIARKPGCGDAQARALRHVVERLMQANVNDEGSPCDAGEVQRLAVNALRNL